MLMLSRCKPGGDGLRSTSTRTCSIEASCWSFGHLGSTRIADGPVQHLGIRMQPEVAAVTLSEWPPRPSTFGVYLNMYSPIIVWRDGGMIGRIVIRRQTQRGHADQLCRQPHLGTHDERVVASSASDIIERRRLTSEVTSDTNEAADD